MRGIDNKDLITIYCVVIIFEMLHAEISPFSTCFPTRAGASAYRYLLFDMFQQIAHVETVVLMTKCGLEDGKES